MTMPTMTADTRVAASKAASIMSAADSLTPEQAIRRARILADLDRELSLEEKLEFAALTYGPTVQYIA
jgi:hypothetical protein